ncbi:glycosyltransferase [Pseudoalteromonas sp. SR43-6]|uniref:glycosyltransferase family 4 protein n=1 Tax=unclassified Pseudoalteromonas TaxID=194690 RepID=UPI0015F88A60|nr:MULTISPECIES: glycosyltransferase [unclassified Pseudoalteromonas]MBB1290154.1 glycosyltransferase [Pseudoalteromonas sp. SR41-5]MBB1373803.1 glycosyltransferase [Pseudoalteromonas sp. SR43-6]MBB1412854.1 glycosyltransferase [Pseudoalteromonas sp. SG43-8]
MKFLTVFPDFERFHLYKDVGQVNFFAAQQLSSQACVLAYDPKLSAPPELDISFIKIKSIFKRVPHIKLDLNIVFFLFFNAKKFKYLNLYHPTFASQIYTIIYKTMYRNGKVYIKLDLDLEDAKKNRGIPDKGIIGWIKKTVFKKFKTLLDVVSVESKEAYELLRSRNSYAKEKLILIPNGVSSSELERNNSPVLYDEKENVIITIARIGTEVKNNQLMLSALSKCDLKNWKYIFIGPIEDDFQNDIIAFQKEHPNLANNVEFLGSKNRTEVIKMYKTAKVFTLSSRKEGFPLVYAEAAFFGCHIITTAVSGSIDITDNGRLGSITPINNSDLFAEAIQNVINNDIEIIQFNEIRKYAITHFTWESIIPKLAKKLSNG